MQGGPGQTNFPTQPQGTSQPRPQYPASAPRPATQTQQTMVPGQLAPHVSQPTAGPSQPSAYQYQQQKGQAPLQQYLQAQSHMQQQGQYRQQQQLQQQQQQQNHANVVPGQPQQGMQAGLPQGARLQQGPRPAATQYSMQQQQQQLHQHQHQQQQQQQQQQLQPQQQQAGQAQRQAHPRPAQGAPQTQQADPQAIARLLQNMPTAEYIARLLGSDKAGVETLLTGNEQSRRYLAAQLASRGAIPGGALMQAPQSQQQPAGVPGQHVRGPQPAPGVNRMPPVLARRTAGPYQAAPAGQQMQGAGGPGGGMAAGPMGGQQPRPNQARPGPYYTAQQAPYAQQATSYPAARPAHPAYSQAPPRPAGAPMTAGSVTMNPQSNTFIVNSQPRPQMGQAASHLPPRVPTPQPPPLTEDDKKFLNKPAMQQLLTKVGGAKLHMKPEVETALTEMVEDLVGQALSFGCSMARRRQGAGASAEDLTLQPADVAAFLEHTWQLHVPGFGGQVLRPYKRPAASELHKARAAAVRRAVSATNAGLPTQAEAS